MLIVARPTALGASPAPSETDAPRVAPALIGPNAIIQVARVLTERLGDLRAEALVQEATGYTLATLPQHMVPEEEALALTTHVMGRLSEAPSTVILHEAGVRTGDYLLANRIPRVAQWLIRAMPKRAGLSLLLQSMMAHAWTFAGSGTFTVRHLGDEVELAFHACAMCRGLAAAGPVCDFYAGTFERLVTTLVSRRARVREVECHAHGGQCCRFRISDL
jgi:divinyl protochlorophyllide a 8-vinyl-reductase